MFMHMFKVTSDTVLLIALLNVILHKNYIPYTYKFSRDVIFADYPNLNFIFVDLLLSHLVLQVYYNCFIKFRGFKFRG